MKKMFLFAMLTILMGACTEHIEDVIMNVEDTDGVVIHVTDSNSLFGYNDDKGSTRVAYSGITAAFEDGDTIGIYAVQGTTVKHSNIPVVYKNGTWQATKKIKYKDDYTYYAYSPYKSTGLSNNFALSGVDNIFASGISEWPLSDDQSSINKFKKCDLTLAAGVNTSDNIISFSMQHKMGLAIIETENCTYSMADDSDNKQPVSYSLSGKLPLYDYVQNKNYYIIRANTPTYICGVGFQTQAGKYITKKMGDINEDYTIQYSTDNGATYTTTAPSWLENISETRDEGEPLNFLIFANNSKTTSTQISQTRFCYDREKLRAATPVSNYDLSTHDNSGNLCAMTTANCYMVHAPGTYKLPLVYGNAIKNGQLNERAYNPGNGYLFYNHNDDPITAPWITKSTGGTGINKGMGINAISASVLWQDSQGLISSPAISNHYLTFTVPAETITGGNAVIVIKDGSDNILWSWHIWINTEKWDTELRSLNYGGYTYYAAPTALGHIEQDGTMTEYKGSTCSVRIITNSGLQISFNVNQPNSFVYSRSVSNYGYDVATYYHFGRKDPIVPGDGAGSSGLRNTYNGGYQSESNITRNVTWGETIKRPNYFCKWMSSYNNYYGLSQNPYPWDGGQTGQENNVQRGTVKTVYDPCPPGFCVPTSGFLYGLKNKQGTNAILTSSPIENCGYVYRNWNTGEPMLFRCYGWKDISAIQYFTTYAHYVSATASEAVSCPTILFRNSKPLSVSNTYKQTGYTICPVLEE